jgi:integrase/recombinase XerD
MMVHIVTRHSADCPHLGNEQYKKCNCWKHLRYRENGKLKWKTTEQQNWAGAERFKTNFLLQRDPAHAHLAAQLPKTVTVRDAVKAFLDDKKGQSLQDSSVGKYTLQLGRLADYLETADVFLLERVTMPHLSGFRSTWPELYPASISQYLAQNRLQAFFRYATKAYRLPVNPAADLSSIKLKRTQVLPFEPEQYEHLLTTLATMFTSARHETRRTRDHLYALIELMRYSGLAIQDAICLPRSGLVKDAIGYRIVTSRTKTGVGVSVPIPAPVAERLGTIRNGHADYFFWNGTATRKSVVAGRVHTLGELFDKAKMPYAHSHMFRHTFAIEWLKAGLTLFEVSKLLGHASVKTTEKYYAAWVQGLPDKMENSMRAHWQQTEVRA